MCRLLWRQKYGPTTWPRCYRHNECEIIIRCGMTSMELRYAVNLVCFSGSSIFFGTHFVWNKIWTQHQLRKIISQPNSQIRTKLWSNLGSWFFFSIIPILKVFINFYGLTFLHYVSVMIILKKKCYSSRCKIRKSRWQHLGP